MTSFSDDLESMAMYSEYGKSTPSEQLNVQVYIVLLVLSILVLILAFSSANDSIAVPPFPITIDQEHPELERQEEEEEEEEEEEDTDDEMPPLIDMARPLEIPQPYLRAKLRLRNPLNLPSDSHFYKAFNGLKSIELNVSKVKEELLCAKLQTESLQENTPRKME